MTAFDLKVDISAVIRASDRYCRLIAMGDCRLLTGSLVDLEHAV